MANSHVEISCTPNWQSPKALAFDFPATDLNPKVRVFIPKSQTLTRDGVLYVSRWLFGKKVEENGRYVEAILGDRSIDVPRNGHAPKAAAFDASGLIEFFDRAGAHIQYPKVTFEGDAGTVQFARAGDRSKCPGAVNVTDGLRYGENRWYGRIDRAGKFSPSRDCTPEVEAAVKAFSDAPVAEAVRAGKAAGACVFCQSGLSTEESVGAGYGPVCASHWGLPWGKKA